jgi:hypothetical protein
MNRDYPEVRMAAYRWLEKNSFGTQRNAEKHLKTLQNKADPVSLYLSLQFVAARMIMLGIDKDVNYWEMQNDKKRVVKMKESRALYEKILNVMEDLGSKEARGLKTGGTTGIL